MLISLKVNKKNEKDENDVGFTVIRVESSVSSEGQDGNKDNVDNDGGEEAHATVTLGDIFEHQDEEVQLGEETSTEALEAITSPDSITLAAAEPDTTTEYDDIRWASNQWLQYIFTLGCEIIVYVTNIDDFVTQFIFGYSVLTLFWSGVCHLF